MKYKVTAVVSLWKRSRMYWKSVVDPELKAVDALLGPNVDSQTLGTSLFLTQ